MGQLHKLDVQNCQGKQFYLWSRFVDPRTGRGNTVHRSAQIFDTYQLWGYLAGSRVKSANIWPNPCQNYTNLFINIPNIFLIEQFFVLFWSSAFTITKKNLDLRSPITRLSLARENNWTPSWVLRYFPSADQTFSRSQKGGFPLLKLISQNTFMKQQL